MKATLPRAMLLAAFLAAASAGDVSAVGQLDFQAGVLVPFDNVERARFDASPYLGVGLSGQVGRSAVHGFVEGGWIGVRENQDDHFRFTDKPRGITYDLVPLTVGVRVDLNNTHVLRSPMRLFIGAGVQTIFVRATDPSGLIEDAATYGAVLEIRPEYRSRGGLTIWVSQRANLMAAATFAEFPDLELSGLTLSAGLGFWY